MLPDAVVSRFADARLGLLATREQLLAWAAEGATLDPPLDPEAAIRRMLPAIHGGLVRDVALKYLHRGLDLDDLIGEGTVALIYAARHYDPTRTHGEPPVPTRFSSFAVPAIHRRIRRSIQDRGCPIRIPEDIRKWLGGTEGLSLTREEEDRLADARSALSRRFVSGSDPNTPLGEDARLDGMPSRRRDMTRGVDECRVLLSTLGERERGVVAARYGIDGAPRLLVDIAEERGVTYQRIQQIEKDAMRRLVVAARRHKIDYEGVFGEATG